MKKIDLTLPRSWQQCSLPQLRAIADILTANALRTDRYHPFDMLAVKTQVFFRLTAIRIVAPVNPRVPVEEQYYTCRFAPLTPDEEARRLSCLLRYYRNTTAWLRRTILGHDDTFALYLWQIHSWLSPRKNPTNGQQQPGMLDWLSPESKTHLLNFPLPSVVRRRSFCGRSVVFRGPNPLMDGFSWQRYRFAQDYMEGYANAQNRLLDLRQQGRRASATDLMKALRHCDLVRSMFLATIYNRRITYVDESTGRTVTDYHYQSNQHSDNSPFFRNFPDRDWQLIMLWWQGMMHFLAKTYPKVFKMQKVDTNRTKKRTNPLTLYTRTTATLEKYLHATARELEREPYTTILQQLEDITRRNEDTEKMNRQLRSRSHKK